ncbi:MAG: hypothetical protein WC337_07170, partial [Candidatus Muiribacteriota bacterium]
MTTGKILKLLIFIIIIQSFFISINALPAQVALFQPAKGHSSPNFAVKLEWIPSQVLPLSYRVFVEGYIYNPATDEYEYMSDYRDVPNHVNFLWVEIPMNTGESPIYWWVLARDGTGFSQAPDEEDKYSFTINTGTEPGNRPAKTQLVSPSNGGTVDSSNPTFTWNPIPGVDNFYVEVSNNPEFVDWDDLEYYQTYYGSSFPSSYQDFVTFKSEDYDTIPGSQNNYSFPVGFSDGYELYWRVYAKKGELFHPDTQEIWTFTVDQAGTIVTPITPAHGSTLNNTDVYFSWQALSEAPDNYILDISLNSGFTNIIRSETLSGTTTNWTAPGGVLSLGNTYYWRIYPKIGDNTFEGDATTRNFTLEPEGGGDETPLPVTLTSPTNGSNVPDTAVNFVWQGLVTQPDYYTIQIASDINFSDIVHSHNTANGTTTNYNIAPGELEFGESYYWRVFGVKGVLSDAGAATKWQFGILDNDPTPLPVTLLTPSNGASFDTTNIQFTWEALVEQPDNYVIQVATTSNFSAGVVINQSLLGHLTQYISTTELSYNTTYFWRVYGRVGFYSDPGAADVRTFTINPDPGGGGDAPLPVTQILPGEGDIYNYTAIEFRWQLLAETPDRYTLQIASDFNFSNITHTYNTDNGNIYNYFINPGVLSLDNTYYWRVFGVKDGNSAPEQASKRSFRLETEGGPQAPPPVTLISPLDGATLYDTNVNFTWNPLNPAPDKYIFQISSNETFSGELLYSEECFPEFTSHSVAGVLEYENTYYWRVFGVKNSQSSPSAATVRSFNLTLPSGDMPANVVLIAPVHQAELNTTSVEFIWQALAVTPDNYILQVSTSSDFSTFAVNQTLSNSTTNYTASSGLNFNNTYYWRVYAVKSGQQNPAGATVRIFTLEEEDTGGPDAPGPVTLISPSPGVTLYDTNVNFTWQGLNPVPDNYQIQISVNSSFSSFIHNQTLGGSTNSFNSTSGLSFGNTYYWRVYGIKNSQYLASEAEIRSFTLIEPSGDMPANVQLISPLHGVTLTTTNLSFSWQALAVQPDEYIIEISSSSDFNPPFVHNSTLAGTVTSHNVNTGFNFGNTYYWRVYAVKSGQQNPDGAQIRSFTLQDPGGGPGDDTPEPVTLLSPANGITLHFREVEFSWERLSPNPDRYKVEISTDSNFNTLTHEFYTFDGNVTTYKTSAGVLNYQTYYWRVYGIKNGMSAPEEAVKWSINIVAPTPGTPEPVILSSPSNGALISTTYVQFIWQALVSTPDEYVLEIDENLNFSDSIVYSTSATNQTVSDGVLETGKKYYWRVYAVSGGLSSPNDATVRYFTMSGVPPTNILTHIIYELNPARTLANHTTDFELSINPTMNSDLDAGFNRIDINVSEFVTGSVDFSQSKMYVDGVEYTKTVNPAGEQFETIMSGTNVEV